ncbi:hypothetical protein HDU82_004354 [Entophlyctis luteolus]|nr:hypothetical protein HDU82_004354 [Entophlyctis luteolus]
MLVKEHEAELIRRDELERNLEETLMKRKMKHTVISNLYISEKLFWENEISEVTLQKDKDMESKLHNALLEKMATLKVVDRLKQEVQVHLFFAFASVTYIDSREQTLVAECDLLKSRSDEKEVGGKAVLYNNLHLKEVVREMRHEMETIQGQVQQQHRQLTMSVPFEPNTQHLDSFMQQQLQNFKDLVDQKQKLIDSLLISDKLSARPLAHRQDSATQTVRESDSDSQRLRKENDALHQRLRQLSDKAARAFGEKLKSLDECNSLRMELRELKAIFESNKPKCINMETQTNPNEMPVAPKKVGKPRQINNRQSLSANTAPEKELEKQRRMKGLRNWNEVADIE